MKRKTRLDGRAEAEKENNDGAESDSAHSTKASTQELDDKLIESVNALPICQVRDRYIDLNALSYTFTSAGIAQTATIDFKASTDLSKEEFTSCFSLIESTSRVDYEPSSFGWYPKRKRREMLEPEMRYLLVRDPVTAEQQTHADLKGAESVAGFLSFMMTHDSSPSVPVAYIYEIHLAESLRGTGLGKHLMGIVQGVAKRVGVEKVMLTCFLSNQKALGFYEKRGFKRDVCSPDDRQTRRKVVKVDYVIMSKEVEDEKEEDDKVVSPAKGSGLVATVRDWTSKLAGKQMRDGKDVAQMRGWI